MKAVLGWRCCQACRRTVRTVGLPGDLVVLIECHADRRAGEHRDAFGRLRLTTCAGSAKPVQSHGGAS